MKLKYNDEHHSYWLDGKRCKGVTTIAKIPEDPYNLHQYDRRMDAFGFIQRPDLLESIAAHHDDKKAVAKFCDDAKEAAKASQGANRGAAGHRIAERSDLGEEIMETELSRYVVDSWKTALTAAGLEVVTDYIERIVVYPDRKIAGRLDRIVKRTSDGELFIVDLKGGVNAIKYPRSTACQCALYANAELMAGPVPSDGGETTEFIPMPSVNKDIAFIFHFPEDGEAMIAEIDIARGWKACERIIFPTLTWRDEKDLIWPIRKAETCPSPTPGETTKTGANSADSGATSAATPSTNHNQSSPASNVKLEWLRFRIRALPLNVRQEMSLTWPVGVPRSPNHPFTDQQLDQIHECVAKLEKAHKIDPPFLAEFAGQASTGSSTSSTNDGGNESGDAGAKSPAETSADTPTTESPSALPEEGPEVDLTATKTKVQALPKTMQAQLDAWMRQGVAASRDFRVRKPGLPTLRRVTIIDALADILVAADGDEELIRHALGWAMRAELQPVMTTGGAAGCMTFQEAARLALLAKSELKLRHTDDGKPYFLTDIPA